MECVVDSFNALLAHRSFLLHTSSTSPMEDEWYPRRWKVLIQTRAFSAPQKVYASRPCSLSLSHSRCSRNPTAFSGISMHPVESSLYFSAALIPIFFNTHPLVFLVTKVDLSIGTNYSFLACADPLRILCVM